MTGRQAIRKTYVDTRAGQVHCRIAGDRERGAPLVLLHQTASSSVMYEAMMAALADSFFVVAPDTPGFGQTFLPEAKATIAFYADVIREAVAKLGIEKTFLFGHHTGASIAVQMATDAPSFARKLALSGPPFLSSSEKDQRRSNIVPVVVTRDGQHALGLWTRLLAKDAEADLSLVQREFVLNMHAGERYHEAYEAVFDHPFEEQARALLMPVLVMAGDNDSLHTSLAPAHAALRNGVSLEIPGGTTFVCDRQPELVARALRAFFLP